MKYRLLSISAAAMFILAVNGAAQTMTSTAELKLACETSPGNVVVLNANTQISTGPQAPLTENVDTPCTISISPFVTFEASQVSMTFKGALTIQGGNEGRALFNESVFAAPSLSVTLANKSALHVERALLQASDGSITISSGTEGTVDVKGPLVGGNLVATGAINISGGQKFSGIFADAEVSAGTGISVSMTGSEAQFVATTSTLNTANGGISVTSTGGKSFVEIKLGSAATADSGLNVDLSGDESTINVNDFTLDGGTGGATLRTGGTKGKVTVADGVLNAGGAVTVSASTSGSEGSAVMQNAQVTAGGDLKIETGSKGNTEVLDSFLTSNTLVRIATGSGGNCKSQNNVITAPVQQTCP